MALRTTTILSVSLALLASVPLASAQKVEKKKLNAEGRERTYYLFVPESARDVAAPLLVLLHGSGRDGRSLLDPWQPLSKKAGIVLLGLESLNPQEWNMATDGPDFVHAIVEQVRGAQKVDPRRIYLFGHSGGAIQGLLLAVLEPEYFAAVAVHAGIFFEEFDRFADLAPRKIPIGIWVGTEDQLFPLEKVRATRATLEARGFPVKLTEIRRHTHRYYDRAGEINKDVWEFLGPHRLDRDPRFQEFATQ